MFFSASLSAGITVGEAFKAVSRLDRESFSLMRDLNDLEDGEALLRPVHELDSQQVVDILQAGESEMSAAKVLLQVRGDGFDQVSDCCQHVLPWQQSTDFFVHVVNRVQLVQVSS